MCLLIILSPVPRGNNTILLFEEGKVTKTRPHSQHCTETNKQKIIQFNHGKIMHLVSIYPQIINRPGVAGAVL